MVRVAPLMTDPPPNTLQSKNNSFVLDLVTFVFGISDGKTELINLVFVFTRSSLKFFSKLENNLGLNFFLMWLISKLSKKG